MPKEKSLLKTLSIKYLFIFVVILGISFVIVYFFYIITMKNLTEKIIVSSKETITSDIYGWLENMKLVVIPKEKILRSLLYKSAEKLSQSSTFSHSSFDPFFKALTENYDIDANYYLISPKGIIVYTNYATDMGFNFPKYAPNIWAVIKNIKPNSEFISSISIETKTGYTRQYGYYRLSNGYILEIGILLKQTYDFLKNVVKRVEYLPFVESFDVFYKVRDDFYKSLLTNTRCEVPKEIKNFTSSNFTLSKKFSHNRQAIYVGLYDKQIGFKVYAKAMLDFSSLYRDISMILYVVMFIFFIISGVIFFFILIYTKKLVFTIDEISLKLKDSNYLDKPLEKTTIKEINNFINAHNKLVKNLNNSLQDQERLNQLLMQSLEEVDKQKRKYQELFENIPNPAVRVKLIFDKNLTDKIIDAIILEYNNGFASTFKVEDNLTGRSLKTIFKELNDLKAFNFILDNILRPSFKGKSAFDLPIFPNDHWFRIFAHLDNEDTLTFIFADIDEVKKMQLKLQESEKRLQIAIDAADEAIWEYNYQTDSLFVSDKGWEMLGYAPVKEEKSLLFWKTIMHPEDRRRFVRIERRLIEGKSDTFRIIFRLKTRSGEYKWIESIGEVIERDPDGEPVKVIGVRRDIDKKKRIDDLVRKAERRYRELMNNSINAIAVYEPILNGDDFLFIDFNQMASKIEGYSREQIVGHTLTETFPRAVRAGFLDILKNVNKTGRPKRFLLHYKDEKGNEVWRDNYIYKLQSGEIVAVYQDLTQEKLNQRTINILSLALQKSKNIIYIADQKYRVIWANAEFEKVTGYTLDEIKGKDVWSIYNLPKEELKKIYHSLKQDKFWKGELYLKTDRGDFYWERSFITVIEEEGEVINIVKVGEDITKEKEMEERLKKYASTDELTKVLNRRAGYILLQAEAKKSRRNKLPLVVAFVDMDHLKKINDTFGHEKGDEYILKMVEICKSSIRDTDSIMRIGGDEFVIIFPESTIEDVDLIFKDRILKKIEKFNNENKTKIPLSISYGLSEYSDFESDFDIEKILHVADDRMYEMKLKRKIAR